MGIDLDASGRHVVLTTMNMAVAMGPASGAASSGRGGNTGVSFRGSNIDLWAESSERPASSIVLADSMVAAVQFSPDGRYLVALGAAFGSDAPVAATYSIYRASTGRMVASFPGDRQGAPMVFSRDSRLLAAETARHTVTIWNLDQPGRPLVLPEHRTAVTRLAFSPDGSRIVTLSQQGVTLFDAHTGDQLLVLHESDGPYSVRDVIVPGKLGVPITDLAFSADGHQIIETIVSSDPKGIRVQIKTWEGGPR